jgi:vacuolar-type H+-ATPase subunit E/Vma4
MTRDPQEIRSEIEETREELADTAAALAYKSDVKARAKERVTEIKENVADKTPKSAAQAGTAVKSNAVPIGAIAGLTVAFALGYIIAKRRA